VDEARAEYYSNLAQYQTKSDALRNAQLQFIKKAKNQAHPYFWAGLIAIGDDAALQPNRH